ncbi:transposase [Paenibacillus sp. FSL R10-2771]|uniref:transposase n=1 Tax=Paenibacillus sp. FSL R10-2771 TaxID=2954693 RepID=UPI0030FBB468
MFRSQTVNQALGSTAAHSARIQEAPASTVQRMHQEALPAENDRLLKQAWCQAKDTPELVLGIDDFAIKKGHTYNTGIHDLRGETMLDLLSGRKLDALRAYAEQHPEFLNLKIPRLSSWIWLKRITPGSASVFRGLFELQIAFMFTVM